MKDFWRGFLLASAVLMWGDLHLTPIVTTLGIFVIVLLVTRIPRKEGTVV